MTVGKADKPYTQDSDGWIEVLNSKNNAELTIILLFRGETLLKQLQFEGTYYVPYMCICLFVLIFDVMLYRRSGIIHCTKIFVADLN